MLAQVPAHATLLNPTTLQSPPTLLQQGDRVHAFALGSLTVYHARSLDGGRTWPLREQSLGALESGASFNTGYHVEVVARPGELLVFGDNRHLGPQLLRSLDDGTTWSAPVPIAAAAVPQSLGRMLPAAHVDANTLFVAWTNDTPNGRIFCNRSVDNGATWQPTDTCLDLGMPAPVNNRGPRVVGSGPVVNVFWSGQGGLTFQQRSLDGGTTWLPAPTSVSSLLALQTAVGDGNTLLVTDAWNHMVRSTNGGTTWVPVTGHGIANFLSVAIAGPLVVAAGTNGGFTFLVNTSNNGGATWRPTPLALPSPSPAVIPTAIARPGELLVQWSVPGFAGNVIRSLDAGATWHVIDGPVQGGFCPGDQRTVHVESTDLTTALPHHHAYVGVGSSRLGIATAGTGGLAPSLTTSGLPVRGGATTLQGQGAVGGSLAALGLSLQAPTAIPYGSATVHLASLDLLFGLPTSGASGQAGAGTFALPVSIPNLPAVVGMRLVAQALVVDGGSLDGFTVTNALEVWLR